MKMESPAIAPQRPTIALAMGDPAGISPELAGLAVWFDEISGRPPKSLFSAIAGFLTKALRSPAWHSISTSSLRAKNLMLKILS